MNDEQIPAFDFLSEGLNAANVGFRTKSPDPHTETVFLDLNRCLSSDEHTDGATIGILANGFAIWKCQHNSCAGKHVPLVDAWNKQRKRNHHNTPSGNTEPFEILSLADLRQRPRPAHLVRNLITLSSLFGIVGDSGSGKSLLALQLAFDVARGATTLDGRRVRQGPVLYICGEGLDGIAKRIDGIKRFYEIADDPSNLFIIPDTLSLTADLDRVLTAIQSLPESPICIVIDTLNRTFAGDENNAGDMAEYVRALDTLRAASGAAVGIIHHHNKSGTYRGSSALKASLDTMIEVARTGSTVRVTSGKSKDLEPFSPLTFTLQGITLTTITDDTVPDEIESTAVLVYDRQAADQPKEPTGNDAKLRDALIALRDSHVQPLTQTKWAAVANVSAPTMSRLANEAASRGLVDHQPGGGRSIRYTISDLGTAWLKALEDAGRGARTEAA